MFGYDGERREQLPQIIGMRTAALKKWPFLTTRDLSMIHNELQLASTVKDRLGISRAEADADVRAWLNERDHRASKVTSLQRWSDDGGAAGRGIAV
jgi:hypothetical protein